MSTSIVGPVACDNSELTQVPKLLLGLWLHQGYQYQAVVTLYWKEIIP